jgi:NAD-dependent deacetylase
VDNLHEQAGSKKVVHMHGELFKSRCDRCNRPPFDDTNLYDSTAEIPRCECGGRIRPHICWFGEVPFELDRIYEALDACTVFITAGTSGVVEPAASFSGHWSGADDLCGTRGACKRSLVYGMLLGQGGRGVAGLARCLVNGGSPP